jgi:type I restriction enzyme M protein
MNLFLHGIEDFQVVRGDTLRNPAFFEGDRLASFDCVIANPPFSLEKWGEDLWVNDPFGRNFAGLPPSSSGDFAWVQHMIKSMADVSGRMAVVLPQGALFRKGIEADIRQKLLEMDLVEAVIGLAPNLFYGTSLAACILVLRKRKSAQHKKKVLIADASRLFRHGRAQNYLEPEHSAEILGWYHGFVDVQYGARVVTLDEIKSQNWTLNISRYVVPPLQEDIPPLLDAIAALNGALTRCREAEERLARVMTEGGWLR